MDCFEIIQPSIGLSPYIKNYWFLKANATNHVQGIIPTRNINLFFHRGNPLSQESDNSLLPHMFISGQSTTYSNLIQSGITDMICVTFHAFGARMFFKEPMHEFKERSIALDLLDNPEILELGKRLQETFDNKTCVQLIESYLKKRYFHPKEYNFRRITAAVSAVDLGNVTINNLANISCLSYKQFKRIFAEYVGLNPKEFMRIIRFQKALYTLQTNTAISLTELAYTCEFYDQSHLISEFKHFSGYTPSEYIAICDPYSDYFSL
ncbi:MAG: DUF6597 domain-containing transcriptional factor [Dysgonomonas sp.]